MGTSSRNKFVLIIDDNPAILLVFSRLLGKKGFLTTTARTGREAWEKFRTKRYDAVLIDVGLPDMEGTDLLRRMGELAPKMVKIVFTGMMLPEKNLTQAKTLADALLLKPVKPEILLRILEEKLEQKKNVLDAKHKSSFA
jgi:DNA-binding NtrC family response regulator